MRVKICGITNLEDASMCEELGADALGFVHFPGRSRSLPLKEIAEICSSLGPMITRILVSAPNSPTEALRMIDESNTDVIQVHSLDPDDVRGIREQGTRVIRAVPPTRSDALRFASVADALLFEHGTPGTGTAYDFSVVPIGSCQRAIIAGGLNMHNLEVAKALGPYALDVSSGVERRTGRKDPELVAEFIRRCKS